jgi:hypothetical protein
VTEAKSCGTAPAEFACEAGTARRQINQWESGLDVVVEGDAEQITDDHVLERLG